MTVIRKQDVISSVADALQYISYYHPLDFVQALEKAYEKEESQAAKDAIAQILINSRMSAEGHRPICQDTGIVTCFVNIGMDVKWETDLTVQEMVDEGVRQAYNNPDNPLRASVLMDPAGKRINTKDNTPAVVHINMVPGNKVEIQIAAKGGGSENKTKMVMLYDHFWWGTMSCHRRRKRRELRENTSRWMACSASSLRTRCGEDETLPVTKTRKTVVRTL